MAVTLPLCARVPNSHRHLRVALVLLLHFCEGTCDTHSFYWTTSISFHYLGNSWRAESTLLFIFTFAVSLQCPAHSSFFKMCAKYTSKMVIRCPDSGFQLYCWTPWLPSSMKLGKGLGTMVIKLACTSESCCEGKTLRKILGT